MAKATIDKQPSERFYIGVDITNEINEGDTLNLSPSVVKEFKHDGTEYLLQGANEILEDATLRVATGNILEAAISAGVHSEKFKISFEAHTNSGDIFEGDIFVSVKEK